MTRDRDELGELGKNRARRGRRRRRRLRIVWRDEWGARRPSSRPIALSLPVPRSRTHHTAGAHPNRESFERFEGKPKVWARIFKRSAAAHVRAIQDFHMDGRGWSDVGYNWIVFRAWFRHWVFEGRGARVVGAHTAGDNSGSIGVAVVGDYSKTKLGRRTKRTLRHLFDREVERGTLARPRDKQPTGGHRDAPGAQTICPGTIGDDTRELRRSMQP